MEFTKVTNNLLEAYETTEERCAHCPYREECTTKELFWGCSVWEDEMGDDL